MDSETSAAHWESFTDDQQQLLGDLSFIGNNGWARNSYTESRMIPMLHHAAALDLTLDDIVSTMVDHFGHDRRSVHQLERWESKRTTGRLGP